MSDINNKESVTASTSGILRRSFQFLLLVALLLTIFLGFIWPVIGIQLRLKRNGAIARQLKDALHAQFPTVNFRGAANYESEVVYIMVDEQVEETIRSKIEEWLRNEKTKRAIKPVIELRFDGDKLATIEI